MADDYAESSADEVDKGKCGEVREVLQIGGELWVYDAFGGNLYGGNATWCNFGG